MKKYENLIKACLVLGLATPCIGIFILIVFHLPDTQEFINTYLGVMFGIFGFFVIAYILLLIFAPVSVHRDLFKVNDTDDLYKAGAKYQSFDELNSKITEELNNKKYKRFEPNEVYNKNKIFFYYKYVGLTIHIYMIVDACGEELSSLLEEVSESLYQTLNKNVKWWNYMTFVTSVFCVDISSDTFSEHLKGAYLTYTGYDFEIRAGYSFDNRTLYIGESPYGGFGIGQVKRLRKRLLKMLGIPRKNLKK